MFTKVLYFMRTHPRQLNPLAKAGKFFTFACYCLAVSQLHGQPAPLSDQRFWLTDGPVNAILATNGTVYIGGDFSYIGPRTGPAALFDQATGGLLVSTAPRINGLVKAVVSDGSGGWFIGGTFTRIGTQNITNVAHLNPDLAPDLRWNAKLVGSTVNALALDSGRLYIGGTFTRISGQTLSGGLAGVSAANPVVEWNPQLSGTVNAMQVVGGLVYVGGSFYSVGSSNVQNLAAISTSTALATSFNPYTVDQAVLALCVTATNIYVGGQFTAIGNKSKNRLAALDLTVGAANNWNPNPNGIVRALLVTSSNAFVGGDFTTISVANRRGFASIGLTGVGTAQPLDLQLQSVSTVNLVRSILLQGNLLYVGGQFTGALGASNVMVVGVDITSGQPVPVPLGTAFNGTAGTAFGANALASANGSVLVGGDFQSLGGVPRQRAAALSLSSGAALPWAPGFNGPVLSMAYGADRIYVGGSFTNYNTTNAVAKLGLGLGAVDPVNGNPLSFSFLGTDQYGTAATIYSLAIAPNALYAGGYFTTVAGQPRRFLAALDLTNGSPIAGFNANLVGGYAGVTALALAGTNLYVAGDFTTVSGQAISRLAAVSSVTGTNLNWVPAPNQAVTVLSTSTDTLYVGGNFTSVNPGGSGAITLNHFAAFSLADNSLVNIDASLQQYDAVTALAATPTVIYVGGSFTAIGSSGDYRQNLGNLSPVDATAYAWNPSPDVGPSVITLTDDYAFVGGSFRFLGQSPTNQVNGFFAVFNRTPQLLIKRSTPGNIQIDFTTGDRADAVLQGTTNLAGSVWTDIATYGPGFPQSAVLPTTLPRQLFRVVAR
jgi:trimeric autotransporter adhesin